MTPHPHDIVKDGESANSSGDAGAPEVEITPEMVDAADHILMRELIWLENCSDERRHDIIRSMMTAYVTQR